MGRKLNALATVGTGSSQHNGIVTASTAGVTGGNGVSGAFTAANLIDLFYSVDYSYRGNTAGWMMRDASIGAVRKLRADAVSAADGAGEFLFMPFNHAGASVGVQLQVAHASVVQMEYAYWTKLSE